MKNSIYLLLSLLFLNSCNKQETAKAETNTADFEGKVEYRLRFVPDPGKNVDTLKLRKEIGEKSTFMVKQGAIKQINESDQMTLQLFLPKENRLYYTNRTEPGILYFYRCDKMDNIDFKYEIVKNAATIEGYSCDKLIYTDKFVQIDYYFAPDLKMDPKYSKDYTFLNRNKITGIMKSVFLRQDFRMPGENDFTLITEAVKVEKMKIDDKEFDKPKYEMIRER